MIRKLRFKFAAVLMVFFTVTLVIVLGMMAHFTQTSMARENAELLRSLALSPRERMRPDEFMEDETLRMPFFTITLDENGEFVSTAGDFYDLSDEDTLEELVSAVADAAEDSYGSLTEYHLRYYKSMLRGDKVTVAFADDSQSQSALRLLKKSSFLIGLAAFAVFGGISWGLAVWMVHPVEKAFNQQKQFIGDASHELKTPLTVIMTNAQMLQDPMYSEAQKQQFLNSILSMSEQMRGLVEQMLRLTRIENNRAKTVYSSVNLSEVAENAVLPFEPVFFEKELTLRTEVEPDIFVHGNEQQLSQLAAIFLDNAQKYCTPRTETVLSLKRSGRHALLTVENVGDEIAPQDLKNIFKRFYRADKARAMNQSYGLGLAIAQETVEAHKGRIWAESRDGKNSFHVQLTVTERKAAGI